MRTAVTFTSLIEHAGHAIVEEAIKAYKPYIDKHPIIILTLFIIIIIIFGVVRVWKRRK